MGKNWRRGKSKNHAVTKNNRTSAALWKDYHHLGTWEAVARKYGVTRGMAYRVAHGYDPHKPSIRRALGLPITAPAPVCAKCGQVHVAKRCTQASGKIAKPRIAYKPLWLMTLAAYLAETKGK